MSPPRSLAEEKEELLARMQASRVAYRRMLLGADTPQYASTQEVTPVNDTFPRSKTVRWIRDHPYLIFLGLATAVLATRPAPRLAVRSAFYKGKAVSSALSRNQNSIRIALGIATALARFIERRRHQ